MSGFNMNAMNVKSSFLHAIVKMACFDDFGLSKIYHTVKLIQNITIGGFRWFH